MKVTLRPAARPLRGTVRVPGDKSVSHRAALLAALARGKSEIRGFSSAGDCTATLSVLRALGVDIARDGATQAIRGGRLHATTEPLNCLRSATTMRLIAGVLASRSFRSVLDGDPQLRRRPMDRVAEPLRTMGARIETTPAGTAPLMIEGGRLLGIEHRPEVASAQLTSAVLLAGLGADGETTVVQRASGRDHTERILAWLDAPIRREPGRVTVERFTPSPFGLDVPGDFSSAAFLLAAAALVEGSDLTVEGVGLNPTRLGFVEALSRMGADVDIEPDEVAGPEPVGRIRARHRPLHAVVIEADDVPALIDELPLLALVATAAEGITVVRGAGELRVKESDRVAGVVGGLRAVGADVQELPDGFVVRGPVRLRGGLAHAQGDHRLAMTFAVAGLVAADPVGVRGAEAAEDSFPGFRAALELVA